MLTRSAQNRTRSCKRIRHVPLKPKGTKQKRTKRSVQHEQKSDRQEDHAEALQMLEKSLVECKAALAAAGNALTQEREAMRCKEAEMEKRLVDHEHALVASFKTATLQIHERLTQDREAATKQLADLEMSLKLEKDSRREEREALELALDDLELSMIKERKATDCEARTLKSVIAELEGSLQQEISAHRQAVARADEYKAALDAVKSRMQEYKADLDAMTARYTTQSEGLRGIEEWLTSWFETWQNMSAQTANVL